MRRHWVSISTLVIGILLGFLAGHYGCTKSKPISVKQVKVATPAPAVVATPTPITVTVATPACKDRDYTVKAGESLWRIAKREYNDGSLYTKIAEASGVKNADLIHPDQTLVIPCYDEKNDNKVVNVGKPVSPTKVRRTNASNLHVTKATPSGETKSQNTTVVMVMAEEAKPTVTSTQPVAPVAEPAKVAPEVVTPQTVQVWEEKASASDGQVQVASATAQPAVQFSQGPVATADLSLLRPGSAWNSLGTTPVEDGNWVNQFHLDQGIVLTQVGGVLVEPYVALNATVDTEGYTWNNKAKVEAGLKLSKPLPHGVVNMSVAYANERREKEMGSKSNLIFYNDAWFGWNQPSANKGDSSMTLPGTIWWVMGNVSPFEKNNVIGLARAEQGVTVAKIGKVSLTPTGWGQAGFDSQDKPWNNRYTLGGGLKVSFPWRTGVLGIQGGYECTRYHGKAAVSSSATCGPAVKVDVWSGWRNISGRR